MDFSGAKEIDPLDMCMLFARNDSAPARILDGMGMAQTRWGPAFRNYLFETMETICAVSTILQSSYRFASDKQN